MKRLSVSFLLASSIILFIAGNAFSLEQYASISYLDRNAGALLPMGQNISRSPTLQGLTGLVLTNSAYTLPPGTVSIGFAGTSEHSETPYFSVQEAIMTLTVGLAKHLELGAKVKGISWQIGSSSSSRESGPGDSEIMFKGRLNKGDDYFPALAIGLGAILPTGDETKGMSEVKDWGMRVSFMASQETLIMGDYYMGAYLEVQGVFIDTLGEADKPGSDRYIKANAGVLLPLTESRHLQFLLEYSRTGRKQYASLLTRRQAVYSPMLRYAGKTFTATAGAQYVDSLNNNRDDTIKYVAAISLTF